MILNLLNTMLITLGTGASVLNMPKKQPTPPINRATQQFRTDLTMNYIQYTDLTGSNNWKQRVIQYKTSGNNTGMLIKGNTNIYNTYNEQANGYFINIKTDNTDGTLENTPKILNIYQITTYENTENVEQHYNIYSLVGTNVPSSAINDTQFYYRTTTYQTQEDWSQYIDRNDYASWNYVNTLQSEIENPQNGYRYSKETKITNAIEVSNNTETTNWISTDITLTKGTTTYIVQIIDMLVHIQGQTTDFINYDYTDQGRVIAFYYYPAMGQNMYISGTMIIAEGTTEIVDIPGLMFTVLTMPFTFISAAFNLTLFPGTPYQINISNLFMAIIAVMAFIFILKLLIGLKGGN